MPNIERLNQVLQERFRVALYRLPFHLIPRVMIVRLDLRIARMVNFFPDKEGISHHYPTATIVSGRQVDYNRELVHSFGDYVQGYDDHYPKNNNIPRTKDCMYLQYLYTLKHGHELMDLATVELTHCPKFNK